MTQYEKETPMQIEPARCTGGKILPEIRYSDTGEYEVVNNHYGMPYISEVKYDGHRALLHIGGNLERGFLTSRRISKVTGEFAENGINVPQFVEANHTKAVAAGMQYTVFDGEVIVPDHPFEAVQTVMGSRPSVALDWQNLNGVYAVFVVLDILFHNGEDVRSRPQSHRSAVAKITAAALSCNSFIIPTSIMSSKAEDHLKRFNEVLKQGGEGLVIKDPAAPYGKGWKKWKKEETYDMVVTGFTEGNNKYRGMFGAVEFGAYKDGKLVTLGKCSGLEDGRCIYEDEFGSQVDPNSEGCLLVPASDDQPVGSRAWFHLNRERLLGSVIEVKCNGLTRHGNLRHPQFFRVRTDKSASECVVPTTGDK